MPNCNNCIIKELNSFRTLSESELTEISHKKTVFSFKKGDLLFEEGTNLNGIFCLKKGKCKVSKLSQNGNSQIVRFIQKGELIGHRSIISETSANLTVTALEDMEACFIPKNKIYKNFKNNNEFSLDMTRSLSSDLNNANISITNMAQKTVTERLADSLLFFQKTFGVDAAGYLKINLSREEIANSIGTATESSIRLLSKFKKEGLIEIKGKKIKIINKTKLQHITEGY
ncbi:MAG: Crp/Fnr family transcriptional regulator [Flavobacteriaceae bacterium]|nr:Crp/Fnr family transcriptional regulator [Flavobacteriaceae bacterium]